MLFFQLHQFIYQTYQFFTSLCPRVLEFLSHSLVLVSPCCQRLQESTTKQCEVPRSTRVMGIRIFNPLSPSINMDVLLIVLHVFLMVLVGRICVKNKSFCSGDHLLYSHVLYV